MSSSTIVIVSSAISTIANLALFIAYLRERSARICLQNAESARVVLELLKESNRAIDRVLGDKP